jgi:predicted DNA-binding transcriptional regulator AlpA
MRQIAILAGVKHQTIIEYRARGKLPPPHFFAGNSPVWTRASIETWLANRPKRGGQPKISNVGEGSETS